MIHIARTPKQLANIMKGFRSLHGLSQDAVAARTGLKQATVSVFEADAGHAMIATLYKLLSAYNAEVVIRRRGARIPARRRPTVAL
jgi:transcriptional regulator with XRE-family HTH domain